MSTVKTLFAGVSSIGSHHVVTEMRPPIRRHAPCVNRGFAFCQSSLFSSRSDHPDEFDCCSLPGLLLDSQTGGNGLHTVCTLGELVVGYDVDIINSHCSYQH